MPTNYVTSGEDDGIGTLRQTISLSAPGDTIVIQPTVTTIGLLSEISIGKTLTIIGPGSTICTIFSDQSVPWDGRCFNLQAGILSISGVKISGFTSTGAGNEGAGIRNETTTTLSDVAFFECTSDSGGGIWNSSTIVMTGGSFISCVASVDGGGAVYNSGTFWQSSDIDFTSCSGQINGGAVFNSGSFAATLCNFNSNSVTGIGGGIYNSGTLELTDSSLLQNSATVSGASIYNELGTVVLTRCTVARTTGVVSVANQTGTLGIYNSTLSKNTVGAVQGSTGNATEIKNSTLVANGSGIISDATGVYTFWNCIIAGNTNFDLNIDPTEYIDGGYNLFGLNDSGITLKTGDSTGVSYDNIKISALADNGGPTETMALNTGSPAIDSGTNTDAPATDQRGEARIINSTIDIGAFEFQGSASPDEAQAVADTSSCFICYGANGPQSQMLALLSQIVKTLNPMAATDPQSLLNASRCYQCFGPMSAGEAMMLGLVSLMQTAIVSGAAGSVWGSGSPVGVVTPGYKGQIYTDLDVPGGVWIATGTTNADWRQFIGP